MPTEPELSKAERLAIGGEVAPVLRRRAGAPRKVTLVGKDGQPTGTTTDIEVAKSLLARSEIEFSVQEGKRPAFVNCKTCGRPVKVPKCGGLPKTCRSGTYQCACGAPLKGNRCRFGGKCGRCHSREWSASLTPEQRKENGRKRWKTMTPEQRSEQARAATSGLTPEQRAENARSGAVAMLAATTPEQRQENARIACAAANADAGQRRARGRKAAETIAKNTTPEQRREQAVRAGAASLAAFTREQRSEVARRVNAERAARKRAAAVAQAPECTEDVSA